MDNAKIEALEEFAITTPFDSEKIVCMPATCQHIHKYATERSSELDYHVPAERVKSFTLTMKMEPIRLYNGGYVDLYSDLCPSEARFSAMFSVPVSEMDAFEAAWRSTGDNIVIDPQGSSFRCIVGDVNISLGEHAEEAMLVDMRGIATEISRST